MGPVFEALAGVTKEITLRRPHNLLSVQGPEDGPGKQRGVPAVTLSLETGFSDFTVFGHTHWLERRCSLSWLSMQQLQADNTLTPIHSKRGSYHLE